MFNSLIGEWDLSVLFKESPYFMCETKGDWVLYVLFKESPYYIANQWYVGS